jgi:signal peptidase I
VISQPEHTSSIIASLSIQGVRQGQSIWFRIVSGSMKPLLRVGDAVYIQSATAHDIQSGEIAAFETSAGLTVHRILHRRQKDGHVELMEMGDVAFQAYWIKEHALIGRVVATRRGKRQINLQTPIAKRCGRVTASLRYGLYCLYNGINFHALRVVLRKCARLTALANALCVHVCSASLVRNPVPHSE